MQLAIDTSTDTASIAIVQNSQVLAELTWNCGQNHTVELLPRLTQLLDETSELFNLSVVLLWLKVRVVSTDYGLESARQEG